jgi:hypothetical protein
LKVARIVVDDPTINAITVEASSAEISQHSLRLQIIQGTQHIRSYLASVDRLMRIYNQSVAGTGTPGLASIFPPN